MPFSRSAPLVPLIRAEAQKALDLDPSEPTPHALLGALAAVIDYDWKEAAEQFRLAAAANTATPEALWAYAAFYLAPLGRFQESSAVMQRAVEQDPLNASIRGILAMHLNIVGRYEEAVEEMRKALEIDDQLWAAHFLQGSIYLQKGRLAEAVAAAERAHHAAPWHSMPAGLLAAALVRVGERDRAAALIREMGDAPLPVWGRILYHLLCSETDRAVDWFEKAIDQRDPFVVVFARAPVSQALRDSPRWPALARRMNLPDALS